MDQVTAHNIGDIPYPLPLFLGRFAHLAEVVTRRKGGCFGPAARADFGENLADVMLGCFGTDDQPLGNLAVRETPGNQ